MDVYEFWMLIPMFRLNKSGRDEQINGKDYVNMFLSTNILALNIMPRPLDTLFLTYELVIYNCAKILYNIDSV